MNIESSYKFYRSGDVAYGCIEGVSHSEFQVGVVGAKEIDRISQHEGVYIIVNNNNKNYST